MCKITKADGNLGQVGAEAGVRYLRLRKGLLLRAIWCCEDNANHQIRYVPPANYFTSPPDLPLPSLSVRAWDGTEQTGTTTGRTILRTALTGDVLSEIGGSVSRGSGTLRLEIVEQSDALSFSLVTGTMYNSLRSIGTLIDGRTTPQQEVLLSTLLNISSINIGDRGQGDYEQDHYTYNIRLNMGTIYNAKGTGNTADDVFAEEPSLDLSGSTLTVLTGLTASDDDTNRELTDNVMLVYQFLPDTDAVIEMSLTLTETSSPFTDSNTISFYLVAEDASPPYVMETTPIGGAEGVTLTPTQGLADSIIFVFNEPVLVNTDPLASPRVILSSSGNVTVRPLRDVDGVNLAPNVSLVVDTIKVDFSDISLRDRATVSVTLSDSAVTDIAGRQITIGSSMLTTGATENDFDSDDADADISNTFASTNPLWLTFILAGGTGPTNAQRLNGVLLDEPLSITRLAEDLRVSFGREFLVATTPRQEVFLEIGECPPMEMGCEVSTITTTISRSTTETRDLIVSPERVLPSDTTLTLVIPAATVTASSGDARHNDETRIQFTTAPSPTISLTASDPDLTQDPASPTSSVDISETNNGIILAFTGDVNLDISQFTAENIPLSVENATLTETLFEYTRENIAYNEVGEAIDSTQLLLALPPGFLSAAGQASLFGNAIYRLSIPPGFIVDVNGNPATINEVSPDASGEYSFSLSNDSDAPFFVPLSDVPLVFEAADDNEITENAEAAPLSGVIELTLNEYVRRNGSATVQLYYYEDPNEGTPSPEALRLFATYDLMDMDPLDVVPPILTGGAYLPNNDGTNKLRIRYETLPGNTEFYVNVDAEAFVDFSGNSSLSIDVDTYRFRTEQETGTNITRPTIENITINDRRFPDATPTYYQEVPVGMASSTFLNVTVGEPEFVLRFSEPVRPTGESSLMISLTAEGSSSSMELARPQVERRAGTEWVLHFEGLDQIRLTRSHFR